jgi:phospholipid/cholesterol/gamma-HCH transport system substrate-binding protein
LRDDAVTRATLRDALIGLGYLTLVVALIALSIGLYNHAFTHYTTVWLRADTAGNSLEPGSEVKVRGVQVGRVATVSSAGDGARIELQLDPDQAAHLPADVQGELLPATLFGERYVSLVAPAGTTGPALASGQTIEENRSAQTVQLENLFTDLLPVLKTVQPVKLDSVLGELATGLRGEGQDLGKAFAAANHSLRRLEPNLPALTHDFSALATVARHYSAVSPQLLDGLRSLTVTARTIVADRAEVQQLFTSAASVGNGIGDFVGENQQAIIGLSKDSVPSLRLLARYSPELPCLARALVAYEPTADQAFGVGTDEPGAHVILHIAKRRLPYRHLPRYTAHGGPRCPYVGADGLASTALAGDRRIAGASSPEGSFSAIGSANSPQENRLIADLMAPAAGKSPTGYPGWASLVLGPLLRGAAVTVR